MPSLDVSRLGRLAAAGAAAGALTFLIFNSWMIQVESGGGLGAGLLEMIRSGFVSFLSSLVLSGFFAAAAGGMLLLIDEIGSPPRRIAAKVLLALGVGALVGTVSGFVAQFLFGLIGMLSLISGMFGSVLLVIGRAAAWALIGGGAGAGIGYALGSRPRAALSAFGGLIGGFAGGLLFELLGWITGAGSAGRFAGFTLMGMTTGAAIALFEDVVKQSWVTVLSGPKEGKTYILTKPITTVGRDELADIPLFGAPGVAKGHACLSMADSVVTLETAPGENATVNGAQVQNARLNDWDVVTIGAFSLRFHQKATQQQPARASAAVQQKRFDPAAQAPPQPAYTPCDRTDYSRAAIAKEALVLTVAVGPHAGRTLQFGPGSVGIGREAGCAIHLPQDTMVSRSHAQITWTGSNWSITDLGSTNGLYVNGARVTQHLLKPGDQVGVGETVIRVDAA